jgi:hypothetical protein
MGRRKGGSSALTKFQRAQGGQVAEEALPPLLHALAGPLKLGDLGRHARQRRQPRLQRLHLAPLPVAPQRAAHQRHLAQRGPGQRGGGQRIQQLHAQPVLHL